MKTSLLKILVCPACQDDLICQISQQKGDNIFGGLLSCTTCSKTYPIVSGIPRFVEHNNYAGSFGYQWNQFKFEQIDSHNETELSADRFFSETRWTTEWMKGKWILDAGCGAGRFLEVASRTADCEVVGVDISSAIDACLETVGKRENVQLVQASLFDLPFRPGSFDGAYCIGVIQHTPDPQQALRSLPKVLKKDAPLAVTIYERKPWTLLNGKYLVRPITKRLEKRTLLQLLKLTMPFIFPLTEILFRIPFLGQVFRFIIPVANYPEKKSLNLKQRYQWALMDTFDMLSPQYDSPQTEREVVTALKESGLKDLTRLPCPGVNIAGVRNSDL